MPIHASSSLRELSKCQKSYLAKSFSTNAPKLPDYISDWIADKLKQEFTKVLVFPNMDDFYIPVIKI
jgi:hypothetical protein